MSKNAVPTLPVWARRSGDGVVLDLHVVPRAKQNAIAGLHGERLKVSLQAPPVDGKANRELIRFLAQRLSLRSSDLEVVRGARSRDKSVLVTGRATPRMVAKIMVLAETRSDAP